MSKRVVIIDGHPDARKERFCHALAHNYAQAANQAGHLISRLDVAELQLTPLKSKEEWEARSFSADIIMCQEAIDRAEHVVLIYPLWLGSMPAMLKAFFEQVLRPGFALRAGLRGTPVGLLVGKSCRIIVTMGMPAYLYRWYFFSHSLKSLERNILRLAGFSKIRQTLIGSIESSETDRQRALLKVRELGRLGI